MSELNRETYRHFCDTMKAELRPASLLEECYVAEIIGAAWRLRRFDAAENQDSLPDEKSIDRARAAAHNLLNRSINQLRKIQTERIARTEIDWAKLNFPPLADTRKAQLALISQYRLDQQMRDLQSLASNCKTENQAPHHAPVQPKTVPQVGRNAPCPCRSGQKFKRCCLGKVA